MNRADEPSTYLWENMGYSPAKQRTWCVLVMICLTLILAAAYKLQFQM